MTWKFCYKGVCHSLGGGGLFNEQGKLKFSKATNESIVKVVTRACVMLYIRTLFFAQLPVYCEGVHLSTIEG